MLELGATTVALICVYCCCDGVEKPTGCVPRFTIVVPAPTGWKLVASCVAPPGKLTGLVVIEPTPSGFWLVTSIAKGPIPGLSWP